MTTRCPARLNDVPAHRGAMRVLKGSRAPTPPLAASSTTLLTWLLVLPDLASFEGWERKLTPEQKACLPRVHGINPEPVLGQATYGTLGTSYPECLPPPPPGQPPYLQQRPTPMVARRGQVLVLCSTCLHSAWQ